MRSHSIFVMHLKLQFVNNKKREENAYLISPQKSDINVTQSTANGRYIECEMKKSAFPQIHVRGGQVIHLFGGIE